MEYWKIVIIIFAPPPPKMKFHIDVQLPLSNAKSTPNVLKFLNTIIVRLIVYHVISNIVLINAVWKKLTPVH